MTPPLSLLNKTKQNNAKQNKPPETNEAPPETNEAEGIANGLHQQQTELLGLNAAAENLVQPPIALQQITCLMLFWFFNFVYE